MKRALAVLLALVLASLGAAAESLPSVVTLMDGVRPVTHPAEIEIIRLFEAGDKDGAYDRIRDRLAALTEETPQGELDAAVYYETPEELALYGALLTDEIPLAGRAEYPILIYYQGFLLVDDGRYQEAAEHLEKALALNPMRISTAMELSQCCTALRDYEGALELLGYIRSLCLLPEDIAWYYRRLGFIACEMGQYELSRHCQLYSLLFEDSDMAYSELEFVDYLMGNAAFDYRQPGDGLSRMREEAIRDMADRELLFSFEDPQAAILLELAAADASNLYSRALDFYAAMDDEVKVMKPAGNR